MWNDTVFCLLKSRSLINYFSLRIRNLKNLVCRDRKLFEKLKALDGNELQSSKRHLLVAMVQRDAEPSTASRVW
jgi:hypothetical protein